MIHKNNEHPEGKYIPPDRRIFAMVSPCTTRPMTEEEWEYYGEPNPVERHADPYAREELLYVVTQEDKDFAAKVKEERTRRGLTQVEFGALCGVSGTTIGKIEGFYHRPAPSTKRKLCKYFGWEDDIDDR